MTTVTDVPPATWLRDKKACRKGARYALQFKMMSEVYNSLINALAHGVGPMAHDPEAAWTFLFWINQQLDISPDEMAEFISLPTHKLASRFPNPFFKEP